VFFTILIGIEMLKIYVSLKPDFIGWVQRISLKIWPKNLIITIKPRKNLTTIDLRTKTQSFQTKFLFNNYINSNNFNFFCYFDVNSNFQVSATCCSAQTEKLISIKFREEIKF
jgi:hypothetical protein